MEQSRIANTNKGMMQSHANVTSTAQSIAPSLLFKDGVPVESQVKDNGDGTYAAFYIAASPHPHTVNITLHRTPLEGAPWSPKVSGADAASSNAFGPGLEKGNAGKPAPFKIQARTKSGAPHKYGSDPFEIKVKNQKTGEVFNGSVKDNGDGTYEANYTVPDGKYVVEVSLNGAPVGDGVYPVTILNATPENSYAVGPGLEGGQQHSPATFTVFAVDVHGHPANKGGEPFEVKIHGPSHHTSTHIQDNEDGTYTVAYSPSEPGDYKVEVLLHGHPIKNTPATAHIKPAPDPSNSYAERPGLEGGQAEKPSAFKIHAKDFNNNLRTDGGDNFKQPNI